MDRPSPIALPAKGSALEDIDLEQENEARKTAEQDAEYQTDIESRESIFSNDLTRRLLKFGVEEVGVHPIPTSERTDGDYKKVFTLWVAMSVSVLPVSTGILGPLEYGLSLRDSSLVIIFFGLLTCIPVAYLSTLGPRTGLRQMVQARYSFGYYGAILIQVLNLCTLGGFCVVNAIIGAQTLAAVSGTNLSPAAGVVVVSIIALCISFCGYRVLHLYEAIAWIPALICLIIAAGCGGKALSSSNQVATTKATAPEILSFGALIAGYVIPYAGMASDFFIYVRPEAPPARIFAYTFGGLLIPTIPLMILGAAAGAVVPNIPAWDAANSVNSIGGVVYEMLTPAKGFGKFVAVLLALSVIGNITATFYAISLNFQVVFPPFGRLPRYFFAVVATAVVIPVGIVGYSRFYATLFNFLGLIGYWSASYSAIVCIEHFVFRKRDPLAYRHSSWNRPRELPSGLAAIAAGLCSVGIIVPTMNQIWYTGAIAKITGDIGFECAFIVAGLTYLPLRTLEIRLQGRV